MLRGRLSDTTELGLTLADKRGPFAGGMWSGRGWVQEEGCALAWGRAGKESHGPWVAGHRWALGTHE